MISLCCFVLHCLVLLLLILSYLRTYVKDTNLSFAYSAVSYLGSIRFEVCYTLLKIVHMHGWIYLIGYLQIGLDISIDSDQPSMVIGSKTKKKRILSSEGAESTTKTYHNVQYSYWHMWVAQNKTYLSQCYSTKYKFYSS